MTRKPVKRIRITGFGADADSRAITPRKGYVSYRRPGAKKKPRPWFPRGGIL